MIHSANAFRSLGSIWNLIERIERGALGVKKHYDPDPKNLIERIESFRFFKGIKHVLIVIGIS